ncbi:AraC family transcriptional regulator [Luteolibacter flavescens]|uniref:AraC family transcriptional regulator n=1 Tax=Luteolibacter flavescens TaxID=1859460 RepID=A0ABT3FLB3_9BACT|nr:AraC family transcriptional regulator [Luteolibacter flavescens]MCW1884357.1 AraC family transcriptional regulator [Luteolibacter flavescens]
MAAIFHPILLHEAPGVEIKGVDAEVVQAADWSSLLKPGMGHLVLNLNGHGVILGRQARLGIVPGTVSLLRTSADEMIHASRLAGDGRHRFVILSANQAWLMANFGDASVAMHPVFREPSLPSASNAAYLRSMTLAERDLCESLLQPPVPRALRPAWFRGKMLECFSLFGSAPKDSNPSTDPLRQRIDAATLWLRENFRDDLDLLAVAKHVGCAPHYLSRLFKQHSGKTLSQKLREIRIDRAATLLRDGSSNVTEAAFEVGYNSLSHFTKAFVAEKGVRPSDWRAG